MSADLQGHDEHLATKYGSLISHIAEGTGRPVLLLGPELSVLGINGESVPTRFNLVASLRQNQPNESVTEYFVTENLFTLKLIHRQEVRQKVIDYYKHQNYGDKI